MNRVVAALGLIIWCLTAQAGVEISDAWARATAPSQSVGAAYMSLKSATDVTLVSVSSPAADNVEIHRMRMDNGVMKMRMLDTLALPAGKVVKFEPDGLHLMLSNLKKPLKAGEKIEVSLTLKDRRGKLGRQKVSLPVRTD
jgi:copper(I)-binding protein